MGTDKIDDLECDICAAPFFVHPTNVIADEPCHFSRNGGYYCGLCYSFLMALRNNGMTNTMLRTQVLMTYLKEFEDDYPIVDNVISAVKLFTTGREDINGDD